MLNDHIPAAPQDAHALIKLLADDLVWSLVPVLVASDAHLSELHAQLGAAIDVLEDRLAQLIQLGIVSSRTSDVDAHTQYYQLQVARLRTLIQQAIGAIHPTFQLATEPEALPVGPQRTRVLFLCTENSARSQLAEAILRQISQGSVEAQSAGTHPGTVNPLAIEILGEAGQGLRSKSLDMFQGQHFDYVVTVCDKARETCPTFPHAARQLHWSIADPAAVEGIDAQRRAFAATAAELARRIRYLLTVIERGQHSALGEVA